MPERVETCVANLMKDPNFKPKEGKTKEESAWALCNWLDQQGRLKALDDGGENYMRKAEMTFTGPFKVVLPITGARRQIVEKAEGVEEVQLWLHIEASGPERDSDGDRFSETGLAKMVEYAEKSQLNLLDGHYRDLLAAILGDIHNPYLTEEKHFAFDALLNPENPFAIQLFNDVLAGKRHGASIAGIVHGALIEEYSEGEFGQIFNDVELLEVSRTSWPSYRDSFITLLATKVGKLPQEEFQAVMKRRDELEKLKTGTEGGTLADRKEGPEEILVASSHDDEYLDIIKGLTRTVEKMVPLEGEMKDDKVVETPVEKQESIEAQPETMTETAPVVEDTPEKDPVVVPEVASEPEVVKEEVAESPLEKRVETSAEMLALKFGELLFAMQEMVLGAVENHDLEAVTAVMDDFSKVGKTVLGQLVESAPTKGTLSFLDPFEKRVEIATGQLTKSRVARINKVADSLVDDLVVLRTLMSDAEVVDDVVPVKEVPVAEEKSVLEQRLEEVEAEQAQIKTSRKAEMDDLAAKLVTPKREQPGPAEDPEPVELSEEEQKENIFRRFEDSLKTRG